MVLICNSPDKADQLLDGLELDATSTASVESAARIASLLPQSPSPSWESLQDDARYRSAKRVVQSIVDIRTEV
jgi:beta-N-acetylhexosaminidase